MKRILFEKHLVLLMLMFMGGWTQAKSRDLSDIIRSTQNNADERVGLLEGFLNISGNESIEARLLLAYARLNLETIDGNLKAKTVFKDIIDNFDQKSWQHNVSIIGLIAAHHQNGEHQLLIPVAEKALADDSRKIK